MNTRVQKWGNSLAVRIPKALASEARLYQGSPVDIAFEDGALRIEPVSPPEYDLDELLADVTEQNLHEPVDADDGVGGEAL